MYVVTVKLRINRGKAQQVSSLEKVRKNSRSSFSASLFPLVIVEFNVWLWNLHSLQEFPKVRFN